MDKKPGRSRPGAARSKAGRGAGHDRPGADAPADGSDRVEASADATKRADAPEDEAERAKAVALSYRPTDRDAAPTVVASGADALAERIIATAQEAGVPIRRDADLVEILAATEIGDEIPIEAFVAVAEILGYIYRRNKQAAPTPPDAARAARSGGEPGASDA